MLVVLTDELLPVVVLRYFSFEFSFESCFEFDDVVKDGVLRRFFVVVSFSFWHCLGVVVRCSVIPCDSLLFGLQCRLGGEGVCRGRVYFGFAVACYSQKPSPVQV